MLIPVGARKRIIRAIEDRRSDLESDRPIEDSRLWLIEFGLSLM